MRRALFIVIVAAGCSLTPIPDVSTHWSPPCAEAERLCVARFTLAAANEKSVELRGDFRAGAWAMGEPMTKDGGTWDAAIVTGWGRDVQYKFYVDGNRWELDPANNQTVNDGKGNTNSILRNVTCEEWVCEVVP